MDAKCSYTVIGNANPRPDAVAALFENVYRFLAETQFDGGRGDEMNSSIILAPPSRQGTPADSVRGLPLARRTSGSSFGDSQERTANMG